jgi:tetratricopeptide (TPR) repeat protein
MVAFATLCHAAMSAAPRATAQQYTTAQQTDSMTIWQARSIIQEKLANVISHHVRDIGNGLHEDWNNRISAVRVSGYKVEYDYAWTEQGRGFGYHPAPESGQGTRTLDLKKMGPVFGVVSSGWAPAGRGRRGGTFTLAADPQFVCAGYCLIDRDQLKYVDSALMWSSSQDAALLAQALNRLSASARGQRTPEQEAAWSDFSQKAAAWRALAVKPPLADEVRRHRILAEKAISDQDISGALEHYEAGLAIDPVWPEGHFNAAMLYAQLSFYNDAIPHMRAYLELVPDASDAQAARDQLIIWEDALKKTE